MASWDNNIKFGTWSTVWFLAIMAGFVEWLPLTDDDQWIYIVLLFTILLFVVCYVLGPRGYLIDSKGVTIKRLVGQFSIPYRDLYSVEIVKNANLQRIIGNGGFFSYYGRYADINGTKVKVFATRFDLMVKLRTASETYYISPSEPESFTQAIKHGMTE
jgi:hypothetical protein